MYKKTDINKVVHIDWENNKIYLLNYLYTDTNRSGAVGTIFTPINQEQYNEGISKESTIHLILHPRYVKHIMEPLHYIWDIKRPSNEFIEDLGNAFYEEMKRNNKLESFKFNVNNKTHWNELRTYGFDEESFPIFNKIDEGRIFKKDFEGNVSPELCEEIRKHETPQAKV